jgi:hypothetical protein
MIADESPRAASEDGPNNPPIPGGAEPGSGPPRPPILGGEEEEGKLGGHPPAPPAGWDAEYGERPCPGTPGVRPPSPPILGE